MSDNYVSPVPVRVLDGHTDPDSAYVVPDYPYGRLRCKKRWWIESKKGHGQRVVSQTTNPKKTNKFDVSASKPKAGIYHDMVILFVDEIGHVHVDGVGLVNGWYEDMKKFYDKYWALLSEDQKNRFRAGYRIGEKVSGDYWRRENYFEKYGIMDLS